ncbi:MAG: hypothetical protein EOO77_05530 [Oxalobacteraceae bacterium]|nr:MAG: hypothetical protein EOO77_05530 [Oxalobacteraceae bacterium]
MPDDAIRYWAEDPYWTEALDRFSTAKEAGHRAITLNLDMVEEAVFNGDGPAYRLIDAMASVKEHEGWDSFRGAPRLVLAVLQLLKEAEQGSQPVSAKH